MFNRDNFNSNDGFANEYTAEENEEIAAPYATEDYFDYLNPCFNGINHRVDRRMSDEERHESIFEQNYAGNDNNGSQTQYQCPMNQDASIATGNSSNTPYPSCKANLTPMDFSNYIPPEEYEMETDYSTYDDDNKDGFYDFSDEENDECLRGSEEDFERYMEAQEGFTCINQRTNTCNEDGESTLALLMDECKVNKQEADTLRKIFEAHHQEVSTEKNININVGDITYGCTAKFYIKNADTIGA